jgi:hypothetical protein
MAGSRTLKLSILGDVDNLKQIAENRFAVTLIRLATRLARQALQIGKAFAAAAAAAGAAAIAIGIEGVKAAIADEKAQTQLALRWKIQRVQQRHKLQRLNKAFFKCHWRLVLLTTNFAQHLGRLVRSTGDITKAQDLLSTALDISAATGKPVEAIANSVLQKLTTATPLPWVNWALAYRLPN